MANIEITFKAQVGTRRNTSGSNKTTSKYQTSKTQETVLHELTDNGSGGLGAFGTVNYAEKTLSVRLVELDSKTEGYKSDHESAAAFDATGTSPATGADTSKGGDYSDAAVGEQLLAQSTVRVTYATDFAGDVATSMTFSPPVVTIDLCPYTTDYVVPGSVQFTWMGQVFQDVEGVLYRGRTANSPGIVAGQINYSSGIALVTDYVVSGAATNFTLDSLWTVRQKWTTASIFGRTQSAPLKPGGWQMMVTDAQGNAITAQSDLQGNITAPHARGRIDHATGIYELQFGDYVLDTSLTPEQKLEWWYSADDVGAVQPDKIWRPWPVDPTTLRTTYVSYSYLPLNADVIGIDTVRLPPDGRVPMFRKGDYIVVAHEGVIGPADVFAGQTINCARTRLSRAYIVGATGALIETGWSADLDAGLMTISDVTGWAQPVTIVHRIEQMARASDVQINGDITLSKPLAHDFPVGSVVSSALMAKTMRARVAENFSQSAWTGVWSDTLIGAKPLEQYSGTIVVTNDGAMTERWVLIIQNGGTTFDCIGENLGKVGTGSINTDFAPINPVSGKPLFMLPALGWGGSWPAGRVLRLNVVGAITPFATIRCVQPSEAVGTHYQFGLLTRGDIDRP